MALVQSSLYFCGSFEEVLSSLSCSNNTTKPCGNSKLQKGSDQSVKELRLLHNWKEQEKGHEKMEFLIEIENCSPCHHFSYMFYLHTFFSMHSVEETLVSLQLNKIHQTLLLHFCWFKISVTGCPYPHQVWELKWFPSKPVFPFFLAHCRGLQVIFSAFCCAVKFVNWFNALIKIKSFHSFLSLLMYSNLLKLHPICSHSVCSD